MIHSRPPQRSPLRPRPISKLPLLAALLVALCGCRTEPAPTLEQLSVEANAELVRVLRATVGDSIRFQRAEAVSERMRLAEEFYLAQMRELDQRLFDLNADYEAQREDFFLVFRDINELRSRSRDELASLIEEMKSHLQPAEWPPVWTSMESTRERLETVFQ